MNGNQNSTSFTCYFCHKVIEDDTEYGHISTCGAVLEPCANKCGSYIPRNMQARHMKECKNRLSKSMTKLTVEDHQQDLGRSRVYSNTLDRLPQKQPHYPVPYAHFSEFDTIPIKLLDLEQAFQQIHHSVMILNSRHQEVLEAQQTAKLQLQLHIEKIQYQYQIFHEWKRNVDLLTENLRQDLKLLSKFKEESETRISKPDELHTKFESVAASLKTMQEQFHKEQVESRESHNDLDEKLNEFKDYFTQENAVIAALWNDHKTKIDRLLKNMADIQFSLNENKIKCTAWVFDLRTVSQIASENSDRLAIQERVVQELKSEVQQMKLDVQLLSEVATNQCNQWSSTPGHLLWRITEFSIKTKSAKESNTVLKSPILYTHQYGYKIRLLLYLNGLKKWKGRHILACIHVLKGEYDLLLKWPCYITGNITIRDLNNHSSENQYTKYITAKRHVGDEENEEPQESSKQYIFVPHTILMKQNCIKDDTFFIELHIDSL